MLVRLLQPLDRHPMSDDAAPDDAFASPVPAEWRDLALDPPRAWGPPPGTGRIRVEPEDFIVDEQLGFAPDGTGSHALLRVRKRGANTDWVARQLASRADVRVMDVGFAGLKDRHAVTTQWFTVPLGKRAAESWLDVRGEGWEVLEAHAHQRKLPRGALDSNRFALRVRDWQGDADLLQARVASIAAGGVPNYFGPQRFGRQLSNLQPSREGASRLGEYALSAGRSLIFNAVLARRVQSGTWHALCPGDLANLDARGSVFPVDEVDASLLARIASQEVHPTGPLWGDGSTVASLAPTGQTALLEEDVASGFAAVRAGLATTRLAPARRPLRLAVRDLRCEFESPDVLRLEFLLRSGGYATTVLRELLQTVI
jgi:tRNA pseudouridine13 synthase